MFKMNCQDCIAALSEYADGTLGARRSETVRDHLAACFGCQEEYAGLLRVRALLRALPAPTPRPDFWQRVTAAVRDRAANRTPAGVRSALGWRRWALPAWNFRTMLVPHATLATTTLVAVMLLVAITLPSRLHHAERFPAATNGETRLALNVEGGTAGHLSIREASTSRYDNAVSADALVSLHAAQELTLPLADMGRIRYTESEASQADLTQDGTLDIR